MKLIVKNIQKYTEDKLQKYFDKEDIYKLHSLKLYLDDIYYNTGESSGITDWQYDMLKVTLEKRDPGYVVPVGAKIREHENKVKLPYWLGSMDKMSVLSDKLYYKNIVPDGKDWKMLSNSDKAKYRKLSISDLSRKLSSWLFKNKSSEYILEDKLDGVSCLVIIKNGKIKLYTRGDGEVGSDISYLAQYFSTIPKNLVGTTINIRGELIIEKNIFYSNYLGKYANPRNMVSGLVGLKTVRPGLADINFVAYEIIGSDSMEKPSTQLQKLQKLGFLTVNHKIIDELTPDLLIDNFSEFKQESKYEIDGIIVQTDKKYKRNQSGNPSYAFAFKMRLGENMKESRVVEVDWNISKWGYLKPRVKIEPITLGGTTITYATGFNAKYIVDNKVGPGAIVKITRSGDVIPYIIDVVKSAKKAQLPKDEYKWNENKVDIIAETANEEACIKLIADFFNKLGIKHVGEKNVKRMYNAGFNSVIKILDASKSDFLKVPGFGEKMAQRTYDNIHNNLSNLSLPEVLGASGIFGIGIGAKKLKFLFDKHPNILETYQDMDEGKLFSLLMSIEGYSEKTAVKIIEGVKWANDFIKVLGKFGTFKEESKVVDSTLEGFKIVFSSFRDKKLEESINKLGGKVMSSVSKNTNILIIPGELDTQTGKVKKALELNIQILSKEDFMNKYINE